MCKVNEYVWGMFAAVVRQPAIVPIIFCDGGSWIVEPMLTRATEIVDLPFPTRRRHAATPERANPERRNEETMYQTVEHNEYGFTIMLDGHPVATVTRLGRRVEGDDAAGWAVERAMPMERHTTDEQWQEIVSIMRAAPASETRGAR